MIWSILVGSAMFFAMFGLVGIFIPTKNSTAEGHIVLIRCYIAIVCVALGGRYFGWW